MSNPNGSANPRLSNTDKDESTTGDNLDKRVDALSKQVANLRDAVSDAQDGRASLVEENSRLKERVGELEAAIDRLDARTDLLELVEGSDQMDGRQRAVALIQHLGRAAERQEERGRDAKASVNRDEAEAALHHPSVDRTTIYDDMRRAVDLVDDEQLLKYESSSGGETRLKLNLEAGELPSAIASRNGSHRSE